MGVHIVPAIARSRFIDQCSPFLVDPRCSFDVYYSSNAEAHARPGECNLLPLFLGPRASPHRTPLRPTRLAHVPKEARSHGGKRITCGYLITTPSNRCPGPTPRCRHRRSFSRSRLTQNPLLFKLSFSLLYLSPRSLSLLNPLHGSSTKLPS